MRMTWNTEPMKITRSFCVSPTRDQSSEHEPADHAEHGDADIADEAELAEEIHAGTQRVERVLEEHRVDRAAEGGERPRREEHDEERGAEGDPRAARDGLEGLEQPALLEPQVDHLLRLRLLLDHAVELEHAHREVDEGLVLLRVVALVVIATLPFDVGRRLGERLARLLDAAAHQLVRLERVALEEIERLEEAVDRGLDDLRVLLDEVL